jgi:nucleoside-diphosphate-sugar epimerase
MKNNQFKNIFITGGAGYVGSALVPSLLSKGYHVTVIDLYLYGETLEPHVNLTQIKGDIRNSEKLIQASINADVFIHLACISNDPSFDLDPTLGKSINFDAFQNVIDTCTINNVKRLIVASSTSQYGIKPMDMDVTEETSHDPTTDYAKYKYQCEQLLSNSETANLEYVFVRPSTLCGYSPRLRLDLSVNILTINALVNNKIKIFGGEQMRPALDIRDMVRFYELMLEAPKDKIHNQAFNVSCENKTIKQMAEMVKEIVENESRENGTGNNQTNKEIDFEVTPSDDDRSYHVNTDKIKTVLGFECKFTLQDAVKSIIEAYEKGLIKNGLNNPYYYNIKRMKNIELN